MLAVGLLSGCGEKEPAARQTLGPDLSACRVKPDQGEAAVMANSAIDRVETSAFFGKRYDSADLDAVLRASTVQTADYVKALGVRLYRVTVSADSPCRQFWFLPEAPEKERKIWNEASGGMSGGFQLAGLYTDTCETGCTDRTLGTPTIMVNESQDRWTLVHEMMHHNFNKTRKGDRQAFGDAHLQRLADRSMRQLEMIYKSYAANPNRLEFGQLVDVLQQLSDYAHEMVVRSMFEEIAIEGILVGKHLKGELQSTFVTSDSLSSSVSYMEASFERGAQSYVRGVPMALIEELKSQATTNEWPDLLERAKQVESTIESRIADAANKINSARIAIEAAGYSLPLRERNQSPQLRWAAGTSDDPSLVVKALAGNPHPVHHQHAHPAQTMELALNRMSSDSLAFVKRFGLN
jgi:hypothetical protein